MSLFPELVLLLVNGGNKLMSFYHHVLSYGEIIRKAICSVCYGCLLLSYAFKLDFGERIKNIQVRNLPLLSFFFARFLFSRQWMKLCCTYLVRSWNLWCGLGGGWNFIELYISLSKLGITNETVLADWGWSTHSISCWATFLQICSDFEFLSFCGNFFFFIEGVALEQKEMISWSLHDYPWI